MEYAIGWDPAVGGFRLAEYQTALRIMEERGVTLTRAPKANAADWIDQTGRSYDAVGGFPGRFLDDQWDNFTMQIDRHLDKADLVPVDVSQFSADQIKRVRAFIAPLGPRVFTVGE